MSIYVYIAVMALVTYLVRMVPFTLFRKQIKSRFIGSILGYLPYAVLSAMTFPSIFYSTGSTASASVGTVIALVLAYLGLPMIVVSAAASAGAMICTFIM